MVWLVSFDYLVGVWLFDKLWLGQCSKVDYGLGFWHLLLPQHWRCQQNLVDQPYDGCLLRHLGGFAAIELDVFQNLDTVINVLLCDQPFDRFGTDP